MVKILQKGNNTIMKDVRLDGRGTMIIGPNSMIGYSVWIETHTHDFDSDDWYNVEIPHTLVIEGQVYIGARAMILGGCRYIAEGVLIGAGSVVSKDIIDPWTVWIGNPVCKIRDRKKVNTQVQPTVWIPYVPYSEEESL